MSSHYKLESTRPSERLGAQSIASLGQDTQRPTTVNPLAYRHIKLEQDDEPLLSSSTSCDASLSAPQYSSARSRRRDDPDYVPRPRNAFFIFRSFYVKSMSNSTTGKDSELQSQHSKNAALVWSGMSEQEKIPFFEQALREKDLHSETYPDYHYTPIRKPNGNGSKTAKQTGTSSLNSPFHRDFVPTSEIPELELTPKLEPSSSQYDPSFYHHFEGGPYPFVPQRHCRYDSGDPTIPPLPRSGGPTSSLLCDNPYPSAHYLAAASSLPYPSGPHRGKH